MSNDIPEFDPLKQFTAGELGRWMEAGAVDGKMTEATARRLLLLGSMVLMKFPQARVILDAADYKERLDQLYATGESVLKLQQANQALDRQITRVLDKLAKIDKLVQNRANLQGENSHDLAAIGEAKTILQELRKVTST